MGKTRDLFKKIGNTKGTFLAKIGTLKDRNHKTLTEAEEIQKMWQDTQKNSTKKKKKNVLMTQIITMMWSPTQSQTSWSVKSGGP